MDSQKRCAARPLGRLVMTVVVMVLGFARAAEAQGSRPPSAVDSAAVAAVVQRYHEAMERGDSATALSLLADDAVILETGGVETRDEYRSHHLPSDIAFARAVRRESGAIRVVVHGDAAWASSTSASRGEFRGRTIDSTSAELMVLTREGAEWKIRAIHWSARNRRPAGAP